MTDYSRARQFDISYSPSQQIPTEQEVNIARSRLQTAGRHCEHCGNTLARSNPSPSVCFRCQTDGKKPSLTAKAKAGHAPTFADQVRAVALRKTGQFMVADIALEVKRHENSVRGPLLELVQSGELLSWTDEQATGPRSRWFRVAHPEDETELLAS